MDTTSIRTAYAGFLNSKGFETYGNAVYDASCNPPRLRYLMAIPLAFSGVGIPLAAHLVISGLRHRTNFRSDLKSKLSKLVEGGVPILTFPFMFNMALRNPNVAAPALLIGSFDERLNSDLDALGLIMDAVMTAHSEIPFSELADQTYVPNRRRKLPAKRLFGAEVWGFDVMIFSNHLPNNRIAPIIPCLVTPGDKGAIEVLPSSCVPSSVSVAIEKITSTS